MEFIASARKPSEAQALKTVMGLEVSETHLDPLSLIARLKESLGLHLAARHIAGVLVEIARNLSRRRVGAALYLEHADITVELGGAIAKRIAVVYGSRGVQQLVIRADINTSTPVPAKVSARKTAVFALACIADRDMWDNFLLLHKPAKKVAGPIGLSAASRFGFMSNRRSVRSIIVF